MQKKNHILFNQKSVILHLLCYIWAIFFLLGCGESKKTAQVVIYTALDRNFSEPILQKFEQKTGIQVLAKYDTESTKTVGLVRALYEERQYPRCDVFWNNEILHMARLQEQAVLATYVPSQQAYIPKEFCDITGHWTGFAARARIILVNTDKVSPEDYPKSILDLTKPRWEGKFGIARPIAGTTATHVACLFAYLGPEKAKQILENFKKNKVCIESGNKVCAEKVGMGELEACLTDTDDAMLEILQNKPVHIIYPDVETDGMGTLFIPNTVAMIQNCPNPECAKQLIEYLLSPEVESILATGPSAQIPLNSQTTTIPRISTPYQVKAMKINFSQTAKMWEQAQAYITQEFLK